MHPTLRQLPAFHLLHPPCSIKKEDSQAIQASFRALHLTMHSRTMR